MHVQTKVGVLLIKSFAFFAVLVDVAVVVA